MDWLSRPFYQNQPRQAASTEFRKSLCFMHESCHLPDFPVFCAGPTGAFRLEEYAGLIRHTQKPEPKTQIEVIKMFKRNKRSRNVGELSNERLLDGGNIERLEDRRLLAGNVTAAINGAGDLIIQGDGEDNAVSVEIDSAGNVIVEGDSTTTVDDSGLAGSVVSGDVIVNLRGGDDVVIIAGEEGPSTSHRTSIPVEDIRITTGAGNDEAMVGFANRGIRIAGDATINAGSGDDYAGVKYSDIDGGVSISGSGGNDVAGIGDSVANDFVFRGGAGDDTVSVIESVTIEQIELVLGSGDNDARVEDSAGAGLTITSTSGADTIEIDSFNAKYENVNLRTGGNNDDITIDGLNDVAELRIQTAGGDDSVEIRDAEAEETLINTGGGDDEVFAALSTFGESQFTMGGGDDSLGFSSSSAFGRANGGAGGDVFSFNTSSTLTDLDRDRFEAVGVAV